MSDIVGISLFVIVGIALVVIEVLFVPGTTFVGLIGFLLMALGVWYCFDNYGSTYAILLASVSLILMVLIFYWGYKKNVWKKFALNAENDTRLAQKAINYLQVGQEGITISALRPSGIAEFDGKRIEVQTFGELLDAGVNVKIIEIKGNEVFVTFSAKTL
jgi:membrane-bound ClpP family serine protease